MLSVTFKTDMEEFAKALSYVLKVIEQSKEKYAQEELDRNLDEKDD